ncbi:MAG: flagellar basal body rod protein FlgC [Lachnospiraceae bacterium]|nr:flagellar basal body rod protein FlgC [Lachnospiraceae bacterium]
MASIDALNISASGMSAQRLRMDLIAQNIANVNTTRDENGQVYRRKTLVFQARTQDTFSTMLAQSSRTNASELVGNGVRVTGIAEDHVTAMKTVYDPGHPDADEDGYVTLPNVNTVTEITNLIDATRAYEANITAFNATKNMLLKGLEVGKA